MARIFHMRWTISLVVSLLLASALLAAATEVSVKDLTTNPARFNRQTVTLRGTATAVKTRESRKGNAYTTFQVKDASGAAVPVFSWGHPDVKEGTSVEVVGAFQRVTRVGRHNVYNEVQAETVRPIGR